MKIFQTISVKRNPKQNKQNMQMKAHDAYRDRNRLQKRENKANFILEKLGLLEKGVKCHLDTQKGSIEATMTDMIETMGKKEGTFGVVMTITEPDANGNYF